jgi:hypothetical protein
MQERQGVMQRWENFRPSKTALFWSCIGSVAATMVVGFTVGGWVTGGTANEMTTSAADQARQELAATICVNRFATAPDAQAQLVSLKEITSSYRQRQFVEEGGWATMPGATGAERKAASLCAEQLVELSLPAPTDDASGISDGATVAQ